MNLAALRCLDKLRDHRESDGRGGSYQVATPFLPLTCCRRMASIYLASAVPRRRTPSTRCDESVSGRVDGVEVERRVDGVEHTLAELRF